MNYYIDTEFLEGTQREKFPISLFRKNTPPTIDLISIGIVAEDGREYYAISKDFNLREAWNRFDEKHIMPSGDMRNIYPNGYIQKVYWIRDNVLLPIYREWVIESEQGWYTYAKEEEYNQFLLNVNNGEYDKYFTYLNFKRLLKKYGKTNKEIAKEIRNFVYFENKDKGGQLVLGNFIPNKYPSPKFYAYFADYDWVAFCWLFGKMIDLPNGFPMYCNDLKQMLDEYCEQYDKMFDSNFTFEERLESMKRIGSYPKQENEHNALADASWNKKLHEFLLKL